MEMSFTQILLTQAARGRVIPLTSDSLFWVQRLILSGHLDTVFTPSEDASTLRVTITEKGLALLNSLAD